MTILDDGTKAIVVWETVVVGSSTSCREEVQYMNESSYLVNVVAKLSQIYSVSENEIAAITTENSKDIFGI